MDVDEVIEGLKSLDRSELVRLEETLKRRLRVLGTDGASGEQSVSGVVEYRPHADGTLQAEVRRYYRKDGSAKEQGPYWYFRYHEGGKQKRMYLGRTDDPEGDLARKREERLDPSGVERGTAPDKWQRLGDENVRGAGVDRAAGCPGLVG